MYHRAEEKWSVTALDQLKEYACTHPDPETDELVIGNDDGGFDVSKATVANLENNSLNSVRSVAAIAIGEQLRNHPELFDHFRTVVEHLCRDPHPAVRFWAVRALLALLNSMRDFAIQCFCNATAGDIRVAASQWAVYIFNVGMVSHYDELAPIVLEMLNSARNDVAKEGASEVVARWLFHDYFGDRIEGCLTGTIAQRTGVAQVAATFAHKTRIFGQMYNAHRAAEERCRQRRAPCLKFCCPLD